MEEREIFDITIIGGGPTGLFASFLWRYAQDES